MLKNIKISVKLIVVGALIGVIPLLVVAVMAITKSTQGLSIVENEQLAGRSSDIAQMIDKVFEEEKKLSLNFAIDPDIVAAARAASEKSPVSGRSQRRLRRNRLRERSSRARQLPRRLRITPPRSQGISSTAQAPR
jgi:hypothetical protein